jgi:hypothetical protein
MKKINLLTCLPQASFKVRGKQIDFLNDMILFAIKADTHLVF